MKKIKILVVEDEVIVAQYLGMELELAGYNVCGYVATGEEAIEIVQTEKPHLVILDINLIGDIDGIETAEKIIKLNKEIKLIFMTGYSRTELSERAKKLHPLGYFNKPVEVGAITEVIEQNI